MPLIGAVADDLTGATTTGVLLARSGARTAAFFNETALESCEDVDAYGALIVSSNSRPLPPDEAYDKVKSATQAMIRMNVKYFSKRIDTTLRGGIGYEIDAMLDQLSEDAVAVVVPAMPQSKRVLVGGYSIIDAVSLIRTPVAQDVRTPVYENYIPRLLAAQTKRKVGLIELSDVLEGVTSIKNAFVEERSRGVKVFVVDAVSIEDVDDIAKAVIELDWDVVAVDPGPFTNKLALNRGLIREERSSLPENAEEAKDKTVLVIAGSATSVTKTQIGNLLEDERCCCIPANAIPLINGGDEAVEEAERVVQIALQYLKESPRALVIETALHGEILDLDEEDAKRDYAGGMSANRINAGLGTMVSKILEAVGQEKIAGLYTTGGDTMVNVCYQLGVECVEVTDYVIPQTDIGRLIGSYDGLPIIGKGGLTGNDHTAFDIVERLLKESR